MNKVDSDEDEFFKRTLDDVSAPDEAHTGKESGSGVAAPASDQIAGSAAPGARDEAKPAPDWALENTLEADSSPPYWEYVAGDFAGLRKAPAPGESVNSCINTLAHAAAHFDLRTLRAQPASRREMFPHLRGLIEEGLLDPAPSIRAAAEVLGEDLCKRMREMRGTVEADRMRDALARLDAPHPKGSGAGMETITNAESDHATAPSADTADEDPRWTALKDRHTTMRAQARTGEASATALRHATDEQMSAVRERWASIGCSMTDVITDAALVGWRADGPLASYVIEAWRETAGRALWTVQVHGPVLRERWTLSAHTALDGTQAKLHKSADGEACETPCASAAEEMAELAARIASAMLDDEAQTG